MTAGGRVLPGMCCPLVNGRWCKKRVRGNMTAGGRVLPGMCCPLVNGRWCKKRVRGNMSAGGRCKKRVRGNMTAGGRVLPGMCCPLVNGRWWKNVPILLEESLDIERFHSRRAILDLEQVAPLVDGGGSSERLQ